MPLHAPPPARPSLPTAGTRDVGRAAASDQATSSPPVDARPAGSTHDTRFEQAPGTASAADTAWAAPATPGAVSPLGARLAAHSPAPEATGQPSVGTPETHAPAPRRGMSASRQAVALGSELRKLLKGSPNRKEEAAVLAHLETAPDAVLDHVLHEIDLVDLMDDLEDRFFGPDHQKALFKLLGQTRLAALSTTTRAALIHAAAEGNTDSKKERFIRDIFVGTSGGALTALKNAIDASHDHHDLLQLVRADIDDSGYRADMMAHIAAQAPHAHPAHPKVLSDIDDTLYANLKDTRFPSKTVYPGVVAFYEQLSGHVEDRNAPAPMVTFLTARPEDPTGMVEDYTHASLAKKGVHDAAVLSGDVWHLTSNDAMGRKKRDNLADFQALYPEYKTVFIGDSGQGDRDVTDTAATLLHDVTGLAQTERDALAKRGVYVFDTYVGAAVHAVKLGLLSAADAAKVAAQAEADFAGVAFESDAQRTARHDELARDTAALTALLSAQTGTP